MSTIETAESPDVTLHFEGKRCIHARSCVLTAPGVFLANVQGPWLHPEAERAETVAAVAHACPSGAITYTRKDGGPNEAPPRVNVLRVRENGPLAVHGELVVGGKPAGFRATLCRCGQSKNKPYCDGAHVAAGFAATGEPATQASEPLAERAGPLTIKAAKNGPLGIAGNLELCSGTGRTVTRTTSAWLCRCGQSQNKPFCDGTHRRVGFEADEV